MEMLLERRNCTDTTSSEELLARLLDSMEVSSLSLELYGQAMMISQSERVHITQISSLVVWSISGFISILKDPAQR